MPVPHILAGTAGGTTAQLDANFGYFANALSVTGVDVGIGGTAVVGVPLRLLRAGECELRVSSTTSGDPLLVLNLEGVNGGSLRYVRATQRLVLQNATSPRTEMDTGGNLHISTPTAVPAITDNRTMVFNLTSDTNLRISARGGDGVVRSHNLTLA